jgi:hypothetical protein
MVVTRGMAPAKAPPGPRGYPVVGVFPAARRDPLGFFLESARRYAYNPSVSRQSAQVNASVCVPW